MPEDSASTSTSTPTIEGAASTRLRRVVPADHGVHENARLVVRDPRDGSFALKEEIRAGGVYTVRTDDVPHLDCTFKLQVARDDRWVDATKYERLVPGDEAAAPAAPAMRVVTPADYGIHERARILVHDLRTEAVVARTPIKEGGSYTARREVLQHIDHIFKLQVVRDGRWTDHTSYENLAPEQQTARGVKYLVLPEPGARHAVVVFQTDSRKTRYNYVKALAGVKAHRVYVRHDYGAVQVDDKVQLDPTALVKATDAVQACLRQVIGELGVAKSDCIFSGTSKGGSAALYHGAIFGAGHMLPGGPQVLYGESLRSSLADQLAPEELEGLVSWMNQGLFRVLREGRKTLGRIVVHVGEREPHYQEHVVPLRDFLVAEGFAPLRLDLGDYATHPELAAHYPAFLRREVDAILAEQPA